MKPAGSPRHAGGLDCPSARLALSVRSDGEPLPGSASEEALALHLAACEPCRAHGRALAALALEFSALRAVAPPPGLGERIARRASRRRRGVGWPARVAAGLVGFLGLGGTLLMLTGGEPEPAPGPHLFERLLSASDLGPAAYLATVPEYQLLRLTSPDDEDSR
jgi:predicted anti-sigma-YlaC factor YlaD